MDSFVDKIAQRLNGQDPIRANAEAEAAEMKRVKDRAEELTQQLSEYELGMQELRKLCLKNTENAQDIRDLVEDARNIQARIQSDSAGAGGKLDRLVEECLARIESVQVHERQQKQDQNQDKEEILNRLDEYRRSLPDYRDELQNLNQIMTDHNYKIEEVQRTGLDQKNQLADLMRTFTENQNETAEVKKLLSGQKNDVEEIIHKENVKVYRNVQAVMVEELDKLSKQLLPAQEQIAGKSKGIMILVIMALVFGIGNLALTVLQIVGIL